MLTHELVLCNLSFRYNLNFMNLNEVLRSVNLLIKPCNTLIYDIGILIIDLELLLLFFFCYVLLMSLINHFVLIVFISIMHKLKPPILGFNLVHYK